MAVTSYDKFFEYLTPMVGTIRISLGKNNTVEDINRIVKALSKILVVRK